jgi:hypothetical protein
MSRLILLDSGPLGMVTNPKATGTPLDCQLWLKSLLRRGERVAIPEISDYEVRRELLRAGLLRSLHLEIEMSKPQLRMRGSRRSILSNI